MLNVLLAQALERRGLWSVPESIRRGVGGDPRRLPDVTLADLWGVRIIVEGKILDNEADRGRLLASAQRRVEEGLCPICLAVLYPPELRNVRTLAGRSPASRGRRRESCWRATITCGRS